jgi:copper(I)-binding protein
MKHFLACLLLGLFSNAFAATDSYKIGDLVIKTPYSRSTPPMAPVGGGFMTIINNGPEADTLISGSASFSKAFEIHEMSMKDGIMKMAELENGLTIPAGEAVELKPGGYHLMFITLSEQLKPDERRKATLKFEKAGEVEVEFVVRDILKMDHSKMDHSKMKHSDMSDDKMDHSKMKMDQSKIKEAKTE